MQCQGSHSSESLASSTPQDSHTQNKGVPEDLPILQTRGNIDTIEIEPTTPQRASTDLLIPMKERLMSLPQMDRLSSKKKVQFKLEKIKSQLQLPVRQKKKLFSFLSVKTKTPSQE